jgi:hypothetical protein
MPRHILVFILTATAPVAAPDRSSLDYSITDERAIFLFPLAFEAPSYFVLGAFSDFAGESLSPSYSLLSGIVADGPLHVIEPPEILGNTIAVRNGRVLFQVRGPPGQNLTIQASMDFVRWFDITSTILLDVPWEFAEPSTHNHRYYRAVVMPQKTTNILPP